MPIALPFFVALTLAAAQDPRGTDAVAVFEQSCVAASLDGQERIDTGRFRRTPLSPETVRHISPDRAGKPVWDISSPASNLRALYYLETDPRACVIEVAEAEESVIRPAFETMVERIARSHHGSAALVHREQRDIQGKAMTTTVWRVEAGESGAFLVGLSTYPEPKFAIQHVMTISPAQ